MSLLVRAQTLMVGTGIGRVAAAEGAVIGTCLTRTGEDVRSGS